MTYYKHTRFTANYKQTYQSYPSRSITLHTSFAATTSKKDISPSCLRITSRIAAATSLLRPISFSHPRIVWTNFPAHFPPLRTCCAMALHVASFATPRFPASNNSGNTIPAVSSNVDCVIATLHTSPAVFASIDGNHVVMAQVAASHTRFPRERKKEKHAANWRPAAGNRISAGVAMKRASTASCSRGELDGRREGDFSRIPAKSVGGRNGRSFVVRWRSDATVSSGAFCATLCAIAANTDFFRKGHNRGKTNLAVVSSMARREFRSAFFTSEFGHSKSAKKGTISSWWEFQKSGKRNAWRRLHRMVIWTEIGSILVM